jgi:membrane-bound lytic murein transglycosylase A
MLRINYHGHSGYPYVPVGRILIERNIIPREEISLERIREWMRANPQSAEEVRRQNRSFVFFRIAGLSDNREAVGAEGLPLTPGPSRLGFQTEGDSEGECSVCLGTHSSFQTTVPK